VLSLLFIVGQGFFITSAEILADDLFVFIWIYLILIIFGWLTFQGTLFYSIALHFLIRYRREAKVPSELRVPVDPTKLPYLLQRYKAVFIDGFLIMIMVITGLLFSEFMQIDTFWVFMVYVCVFLSYEPILTYHSATIGQRIIGVRIRNIRDTERRISLIQSYLRFFTKLLLGWLSFITISFNPDKRAIHDLVGSSIAVLNEDEDSMKPVDFNA
jgi:uncharacterized RDD family membrane protein YckC